MSDPLSQSLISTRRDVPLGVTGKNGYDSRRTVAAMNRFIRAYNANYGIIKVACSVAGVSMRTYYRWLNGTAQIHLRFQRKMMKTFANEAFVDLAESRLVADMENLVSKGGTTAAMFVLKTRGKKRGYTEKEPEKERVDPSLLDRVVNAFQHWMVDHPDADQETVVLWMCRFADGAGVPRQDVAARLGISLDQYALT